jgi:hypothetical protein
MFYCVSIRLLFLKLHDISQQESQYNKQCESIGNHMHRTSHARDNLQFSTLLIAWSFAVVHLSLRNSWINISLFLLSMVFRKAPGVPIDN